MEYEKANAPLISMQSLIPDFPEFSFTTTIEILNIAPDDELYARYPFGDLMWYLQNDPVASARYTQLLTKIPAEDLALLEAVVVPDL